MGRAKFDPNRILGARIKDMDRQELCELVAKLCAVIRAQAGAGGVRGGIFPDNISMDDSGSVALGPARQSDWDGQELQFIAPELYWNGKRSPASDVYSLGLLLYYGVNKGRLPFDGECSDPQLRRMGGDQFPVPPAAGRRLGEIIARATQFKATDRYQSMEELGVLLDGCIKNLYLNGAPSAETIFNKNDDDLNDLERMMVSIIERADAAPLAAQEPPAETVESEPSTPAEAPEEAPEQTGASAEAETAREPEEQPEEMPAGTAEDTPEESVKIYAGKDEDAPVKKQPVVRLREEKNPELAPVVPVKTPAVQYTKSHEREKRQAEELKKRRRRSVAVILTLCAALIIIAIVFNALLHDLNDIPTPDNTTGGYQTTDPKYALDYNDPGVPEGGATFFSDETPDAGGAVGEAGEGTTTPITGTGGESRYEIFVEDVSWTEAQARCLAKGGHLAVITDEQELQKICDLADEKDVQMLWLGCHRVDGTLVWETDETVDYYPWGAGEPSLEDTSDNVSEDYLLLWYHNNGWVYNDSRNDPVADYPQWYGGNIAYVCEYEG